MFTSKSRYNIAMCMLLLTVTGCKDGRDGKVDAKIAEAPVKSVALVEAMLPERRDISEYLSETGRITAEDQVEVLAKGTGHCMSIKVEEGDMVKKGQVLAELDREEMEAQVRQSRVNAAQQKMAYERAEGMLREGIGSSADRDNAKFAYEQAKASLEMQEVQLTFLTIRAPISGVVTKRALQEGMLVSTGTAAFTIVDPASYVLPINVDERNLPRLRVGQEAFVTIDSVGDREFKATVRRINPGVDLQNNAVKVILDFEQEDHKYLREAAFARYRLVMDTREDVLAVPKDAVVEDNTRRYLMVVTEAPPEPESTEADSDSAESASTDEPASADAGAAEDAEHSLVATRLEVETGLEDSDFIEIVSGIDGDDMVITLGQQTVNDGDPVEVTTVDGALESSAELSADEALERAKSKPEADEAKSRRRPGHRL